MPYADWVSLYIRHAGNYDSLPAHNPTGRRNASAEREGGTLHPGSAGVFCFLQLQVRSPIRPTMLGTGAPPVPTSTRTIWYAHIRGPTMYGQGRVSPFLGIARDMIPDLRPELFPLEALETLTSNPRTSGGFSHESAQKKLSAVFLTDKPTRWLER